MTSRQPGRRSRPCSRNCLSLCLVVKACADPLANLIGNHRGDQQNADDHGLQVGFDVRQVHPVLDQADEEGSKNDIFDSTNPAAQTNPSDNTGGYGLEGHGSANIGFSGIDARRKQEAGHRAHEAANHIGHEQIGPGIDS